MKGLYVNVSDDTTLMTKCEPGLDGHYWVILSRLGDLGIVINNHEWEAFLELVKQTDDFIKENYNG